MKERVVKGKKSLLGKKVFDTTSEVKSSEKFVNKYRVVVVESEIFIEVYT